MKFRVVIKEKISIDCLTSFLSGAPSESYDWTNCKWKSLKPGFKLNKDVTNAGKNPRSTNKVEFVLGDNFHKKWIAVDYLPVPIVQTAMLD